MDDDDKKSAVSPVGKAKTSDDDHGSVDYAASAAAAAQAGQVRLDADAAFATGGQGRFYEPIAKYEGAHRFDPKFEWSEQEEKKLVRRVCFSRDAVFHLADLDLLGLFNAGTGARSMKLYGCRMRIHQPNTTRSGHGIDTGANC